MLGLETHWRVPEVPFTAVVFTKMREWSFGATLQMRGSSACRPPGPPETSPLAPSDDIMLWCGPQIVDKLRQVDFSIGQGKSIPEPAPLFLLGVGVVLIRREMKRVILAAIAVLGLAVEGYGKVTIDFDDLILTCPHFLYQGL